MCIEEFTFFGIGYAVNCTCVTHLTRDKVRKLCQLVCEIIWQPQCTLSRPFPCCKRIAAAAGQAHELQAVLDQVLVAVHADAHVLGVARRTATDNTDQGTGS